MRKVDRVLNDVALLLQRRRDIHGGIGDDEHRLMAGDVHHEAMADAASSAQSLPTNHGAHQFVGMETSLHQGFRLSRFDESDGLLGGLLAVGSLDQAELGDVLLESSSRRRDL